MGNYENPQTSMARVKIYQYIKPWLAFNNIRKSISEHYRRAYVEALAVNVRMVLGGGACGE